MGANSGQIRKNIPPSFITNPTPIIAKNQSPFAKKNMYDTGKVDVQIPEMKAFEQEDIRMDQNSPRYTDSSEEESNRNLKALPLIEKTETMKIYFNIVFCNLLASLLIVKYKESCKDQMQDPSSEKFQLFVNQHLLQDPSTFR